MNSLISVLGIVLFIIIWRSIAYALKKDDKATILREEAEERLPVSTPASMLEQVEVPKPAVLEYTTSDIILQDFLAEHSCQHEFFETRDPNTWVYYFVFNGGHFRAVVSNQSSEMLLGFDRFISVPTAEADRLLRAANDFTNQIKFYTLTVTPNEKDNAAEMNLLYEAMHATKEDLEQFVQAAPDIANHIRHSYSGNINWKEWYEHRFDHRREYYLIREAELQHQDTQIIGSPAEPLTIGALLSQLYDETEAVHVVSMQMNINGKQQRLKDANNIFHFDIVPTVYDRDSRKLRHNTILQVQTEMYQYLLHLNAVSQSDLTVYIRLTATQIPLEKIIDQSAATVIRPDSVSVLLTYDKSTEHNRHSEFQYMWLDTQDKVAKGKQSELTELQQTLLRLEQNDRSERIYRGQKLFLAGQYAQALTILLPIYQEWKPNFFKSSDKEKNVFRDLLYWIGFSYLQLHQHEKAIYYMELVQAYGSATYLKTYINAFTEGKDLRVFREIDVINSELQKAVQESDDEPTDEQRDFYEFLLRRRGYSCINFGDLDSAEKTFTHLLDYPSSHDYAQSELNYINGLRILQNTSNPEYHKPRNDTNIAL